MATEIISGKLRTVILAVMLSLSSVYSAYAQNRNLTLNLNNVTVKEAFEQIAAQTGFSMAYKDSEVDLSAKVSIVAVNDDVVKVIDKIMSGQNITASIQGSRIILSKTTPAEEKETVLEGRVIDTKGEPIIGAAIFLQTGKGEVTDTDGRFSINIPSEGAVIEISCLGYISKKRSVSAGQARVTIILEEDHMAIDETVVIGYGTQKKINLTGAVSTVNSKDLDNRTSPSLGHMLQGSVPGLFVTANSGEREASTTFNIRGYNSINGGSPLVLIDGVEGDMDTVNPQDVESVSVIKDASSSAIYGARASFGVILITTKSGTRTESRPVVRYNGNAGFSTPTTSTDYETRGYWSVYTADLFQTATYGAPVTNYTEADMEQLWLRRNDVVEDPSRPWVIQEMRDGKERYIYYCNTDWYHEMYVDINPVTQHNISVNGGGKYIKYYFSAGYEHKQGTYKVRPDNYNKYNLRSKLDFDVTKWLSISDNISFYTTDYDYPGNSSPSTTFQYGSVHGLASFPLQNPDGTWVYKTSLLPSNLTNGCHIELGADTKVNKSYRYNFSNTAEISIHPVKQLDVRANFTYTFNSTRKWNRSTPAQYSQYPGVIETDSDGRFWNRLMETINMDRYMAANVFATYTDCYAENHNLKVTAGFNWETQYFRNHYTEAHNLSSLYLSDFNMVQPTEKGTYNWKITGGQNEYALAGVFARINYDYKEKYLFEVSARCDGTSRFTKEGRWGFFPSASAGWKFSEEDFFNPIKSWWNYGKLRFSYGSLGNQQVGYYDFMRTINTINIGYMFESENDRAKATNVSAPNASDLTWEITKHYNLGLDLGFLGNKLSFSAEAYIRDTEGMLTVGKALPAVYGTSAPMTNAANLRSLGYELNLKWQDSFKLADSPFSYSVGLTFSDYITKITKYQNPAKVMGSYYEGMTIGEIWGFKTDGLFESDEAAASWTSVVDQSYMEHDLTGGWKGGDIRYLDLDGDNVISVGGYTYDIPGDMTIIGNSEPRWQYGITLGVQWYGIDLSAFFQGIGRINWYPSGDLNGFWGPFNRTTLTFLPRDFIRNCWSEDNPDAYFPRPRGCLANGSNTELSVVNDRYLQNIGYFRLRNLTVGYSLPKKALDKIKISGLRFYFTGENLFYASALRKATKYMDPEVAYNFMSGGGAYFGYGYPYQKSFVFGIDVTF